MAQPDSKKIFFENLSGAGKAIAVLTSGGDAQGKKKIKDQVSQIWSYHCISVNRPIEGENTQLRMYDGVLSVKLNSSKNGGFFFLRSHKTHSGRLECDARARLLAC